MKLTTTYPSDNYDIVVEPDAYKNLQSYNQQMIAIIDKKVFELHREKVVKHLPLNHQLIIVNGGEAVKSLEVYQSIINEILEIGVTRQTVIAAIGGGSVGDFAGFIAATILRGVDFIQVPTTLLAHDSAIGGKVGINATSGKNLIGAFKRPKAVYYDLDFLLSLEADEVLSGFAEVIKHAMLASEDKLNQLMLDYPNDKALNSLKKMDYWLIEGMKQKLKIVLEDEFEKGSRKFLNLGHTFGHAVEFTHRIPHGHAVLIGLCFMYQLSDRDVKPLLQWFIRLGLQMPDFLPFETYYELMSKDKKNISSMIQFVVMNPKINLQEFSKEALEKQFENFIEVVKRIENN